jgi:hypothetical protein
MVGGGSRLDCTDLIVEVDIILGIDFADIGMLVWQSFMSSGQVVANP